MKNKGIFKTFVVSIVEHLICSLEFFSTNRLNLETNLGFFCRNLLHRETKLSFPQQQICWRDKQNWAHLHQSAV